MSSSHNPALADGIRLLHAELGIPEDYAARRGLEPCAECLETASIGEDMFGREQRLAPKAAQAWAEMKAAAKNVGVELLVVSAFRSVEYQAAIIQKKLEAGLEMAEILGVSAAPGYSEHHTGRALDLTTPGFEPLEEQFEHSSAFAWLQKSAGRFGFRMSFPRDNPHGLCYEPWHWCWTP